MTDAHVQEAITNIMTKYTADNERNFNRERYLPIIIVVDSIRIDNILEIDTTSTVGRTRAITGYNTDGKTFEVMRIINNEHISVIVDLTGNEVKPSDFVPVT